MDALRLSAWTLSISAHLAAGWILFAEAGGVANEAGTATDQFRIEAGVNTEDVVTFGLAAQTMAEAAPPAPVQAADVPQEQPKEDTHAVTASQSPAEASVAAHEVEPEEVHQVRPAELVVAQPVEEGAVEQLSASAKQAGGVATILSTYFGQASRVLEKHKLNPNSHISGTTVVRFALEPSGRIVSREIEKSSGSEILDNAALASLDRASPLPPVPPEIVAARPLVFSVPFRFAAR
jgi:periplasmic protein TonB